MIKMNYLKEFYREGRDFWKEVFVKHKVLFFVLIGTFVLGILSVFILDQSTKVKLMKIIAQKILEEMPTKDFGWTLFLYIWQNNVQVLAITWAFSFLLFVPFLIEYFNGLVISVVIAFSLTSISSGKVALMILPHGIFELLFFLVGALLALLFWLKIYLPKKYFPKLTRWQMIKRISVGFVIIIIGLGLSAAIETWLTPFFSGMN
jgi:uncharacterized membrane protein SpoIIM required for sporulation